jgi:hypothetical protein
MVRKQFLLSTATICLMLASGLVYAQSPADSKKDDTQKERVQKNEPAKGAESRSDVKGQEKSSEHTGAKDQKTPAASMEKDGASKHDQKDRAGNEGAKPNDQAGDSRHGSKDAASEKSAQEKSAQEKSAQEKSAQEKSAQEKSAREKSAQDSQKSKTGESKSGAASTERPQNQNQAGETSKTGPAPSQQSSTPPDAQTNKPAAANESDRNRTTNEAQRGGQPGSSATVSTSQTQISSDKQVRLSETLSRQQLPPPERNLNVSISVGTELPTSVRLHRLPPDIISVVPEYRDYEYVTTEEEIVIVDPHSHRIVSALPRDPSRARAQLQGGSNTADMRGGAATTNVAGNTANPCRIMRRDASGQLSEVSPTTVGSTAQRPNSLAVIVQKPDQGSTPPIQLDAQAGQIAVATQGQGDCTVTIEPQGAK